LGDAWQRFWPGAIVEQRFDLFWWCAKPNQLFENISESSKHGN
jgi:hypothetical protein